MPDRQQLITAFDKSPLVEVLTWMFLAIGVVAAIARLMTKLFMVKSLKLDDYLAISATVAAVGQSVAVVVESSNGAGRHFDTLQPRQVFVLMKSEWVANILFITGLLFAKLSLIITIISLTQRDRRYLVFGVETCIILWAVSSVFVVFFQCELPEPWNPIGHSCINRTAFWMYFSITNILTDLALIGVMVEAIRRVKTSWAKKAVVMSVFGSRIFVVPAVVCQIYYTYQAIHAKDPFFDMWRPTVAIQLVQCLSIVTVCVPYFKPFFESLESGQLRVDDLRRQGKTSASGYPSGQGSAKKSDPRPASKPLDSAHSQRSSVHELVAVPKPAHTTSAGHGTKSSWDGRSHSSEMGLIQQTKTWDVSVEMNGA
ncbi:hypothetical protein PT974_12548 [Cladobotryum mycophilum]|uniref:Rhodopsin domain-containing protein n=1 Tax=Cladobotryum mycophilum TaxID=491253 RepID=A0ABR0S8A6_9HYPO